MCAASGFAPASVLAKSHGGIGHKPKSISSSQFSMRMHEQVKGDPTRPDDPRAGVIRSYTARGSKKKTAFTYFYGGVTKKVSYKSFVRFFTTHHVSEANVGFTYSWKRDSHGKKYRYLRSVLAYLAG
jgi:hypothetical protein